MAWTQERTTINQKWQIGPEATTALGTSVAAGKLLEAISIDDGIEADVAMYRGTGRKYPSTQEENREWATAALSGNLDYNAIPYILVSAMGSVTAVAHGSSSTAKDWIVTPPLSGSIVPQTYTIERGDTTTRAHKYTYGLVNKFGYKVTRKDASCDGAMIMQPLTDGITMTSNPTAIAIAPMVAKHFSIYLDPTSGALGTTLLTKVLSVEFSFDTIYDVVWFINRATTGHSGHVDMVPKGTLKILLEADSTGMGLIPTYLQAGATAYIRVIATGSQIAADGPGVVNNIFQHDMAIKLDKPDNRFKDDQGVFALPLNGQLTEDASWGKAQTITVTNLIAAL